MLKSMWLFLAARVLSYSKNIYMFMSGLWVYCLCNKTFSKLNYNNEFRSFICISEFQIQFLKKYHVQSVFQIKRCNTVQINLHLWNGFPLASRSKSCMNYITQLYSEAKIKQKENAHHSKLRGEYAQMPESIV